MQSIAFLPWAFSTCQGGFYLLLNVFTEAGPCCCSHQCCDRRVLPFLRQPVAKDNGPWLGIWEGPADVGPSPPPGEQSDHKHVTWPGVTRW